MEAKALQEKSRTEIDDSARRIEFEVRTAHSFFIEACKVIESQKKVREGAEQTLRLTRACADAGTRRASRSDRRPDLAHRGANPEVQALHGYAVARARMEGVIGQDVAQPTAK